METLKTIVDIFLFLFFLFIALRGLMTGFKWAITNFRGKKESRLKNWEKIMPFLLILGGLYFSFRYRKVFG